MTSEAADDRERLPALLAYGFYLLAIAGGAAMLIGFIIAVVRRESARGTLYEGHYRNLILVFLVVLGFVGLLLAATAAGMFNMMWGTWGWGGIVWAPFSFFLLPGTMMLWLALGVWYLWRVVGGFIRALDEKPY